jgi:seryl-tRNA synthetase
MYKKLLVWNIILTVVLVGGGLAAYFYIKNCNTATEEEILMLRQHVNELTIVVTQQSAVLNEHAQIINGRMESMNEEIMAAIEENDQLIQEMNGLVKEYQQLINTSTTYFEEILDNLESLSITEPEEAGL